MVLLLCVDEYMATLPDLTCVCLQMSKVRLLAALQVNDTCDKLHASLHELSILLRNV